MATQEAYFVPRSEILAWINSTLGLRLSKVEEVSSGGVPAYCLCSCLCSCLACGLVPSV